MRKPVSRAKEAIFLKKFNHGIRALKEVLLIIPPIEGAGIIRGLAEEFEFVEKRKHMAEAFENFEKKYQHR